MKSIIILVAVLTASISTPPDMSGITDALRKGDAVKLATFFADNVELAIVDDEDLFSKNEAKELLTKFFSSNKPNSFSQVHKGTSKGADAHYVIGDLVANGKTYKIYIYLKETADAYKIEELRIED